MSDNRSSAWSVTINNPQPSDFEEMAVARQRGWQVDGQVEKGEEGTPHLQLLVRTPQVRFAAVKKAFARGHIEPARNVAALQRYVHKEDTRVGQLPIASDRYPSLSKYWELVATSLNAGHRAWTEDKDAFHVIESIDDKACHLYRPEDDAELGRDPLKVLDQVTADLISDGYHVEGIACNPATRSAFLKWHRRILYRAMVAMADTDKQTDRQTDSVQVPETEVSPEEHNQLDADDDARTQASYGVLEGIHRPITRDSPPPSCPPHKESSREDC